MCVLCRFRSPRYRLGFRKDIHQLIPLCCVHTIFPLSFYCFRSYIHIHLFWSFAKERMAGPGGGPPRKSHTKSRNGCKTCKRRHIRCDETFPQWYRLLHTLDDFNVGSKNRVLTNDVNSRNCTKHNCRCDYMDVTATAAANDPRNQRAPDLLMSQEIEMEIENWRMTGTPPFPELSMCPRSGWHGFSRSELRLIHHITGQSIDLHRRGYSNSTIWAQRMPK